MKKKAVLFVIVLAAAVASAAVPAGQKISEKDLPAQYQEWLKLVAYIIQPVERDVFMKLTSDRDRDIFIEMFWKQRDPTPGTPENEYKEEMVKRFQYVNRQFGRSSVREGWRTDMGRIYMILGPPASIERFESSSFLVPCQAWTYYGNPDKDLPNLFVILFFQKGGVGDYKLYDAMVDGPTSLLMDKKGLETMTNEEIYDRIHELAPTLADLSISMIPGEIYFDYSPSPRNNIIMAQILNSPRKDVNPSYATHFLNYRGLVSTEYMTNFVDSQSMTALIKDSQTGLRFLHFSIVPAGITLDFYEPKNQHFCNLQANVSLRSGDAVVFQYTRDFPIYIPDENINRVQANGLAIEDSFPVAAGKFKLTVMLMNSSSKEFSILEQDLTVPEETGLPRLGGPYLGYRSEAYRPDIHLPFKIGERKLVVEAKKTFSAADDIAVFFNVENPTEELLAGGQVRMVVRSQKSDRQFERPATVRLGGRPGPAGILTFSETIPARELEPDYYEITLSLVAPDGRVLDEAKDSFVVSPSTALGHPIANAKGFPLANQFLYFYMLARQTETLGAADRAAALYEKGFSLNPNYNEGVLMYADFLIKTDEFDRALTLAERVAGDDKRRFEYHVTKGRALMGKKLYEEALTSLLEANRMYNSDVQVLNAIGACYFRLGQKSRALDAVNASLKLNPDQPEAKRLLEEINKLR
jgi:GWxTD domain-containing protein